MGDPFGDLSQLQVETLPGAAGDVEGVVLADAVAGQEDALGLADHVPVLDGGLEVVALLGRGRDDATGDLVAIFEVTGDPRAVLQAHLDHLAALGPTTSDPQELEIGDAVVTTAGGSEAGGDHFDLTIVERPGRPPWLQISGNHD